MPTKRSKKGQNALSYLDKLTGGPLTLPELLSAIRLGEEFSHVDFAHKLGISRSHLCDIEKGRKVVSLGRAVRFAEILGYSKEQFARLALQQLVNEAGLPYRVVMKAA